MRALHYGPYVLCGWKVFSDIVLPELPIWRATLEHEQTLTIEVGSIPWTEESSIFTITTEKDVILRMPGIASFHVSAAGNQVTIQSEADADPLLIRNFLYGSVLAVLCYKHGLLPLHGASILMNDFAIVFSGASGAGKSTLATAVARHGHPLLCDDVCAIDLQNLCRPLLWPAVMRVKLLPDAIDNFQLGQATEYTRSAHGDKGHFGMADLQKSGTISQAVPLGIIYALDTINGDRMNRTILRGKSSFVFLASQTHRAWMGRNLGLQQQLFQQISALALAVPVYQLKRPRTLKSLEETACLLEKTHTAGHSSIPTSYPHNIEEFI